MKATFTLTEAEMRLAVVEWLDTNSKVVGEKISSPAVTFSRDPDTGAWAASVEVVETVAV